MLMGVVPSGFDAAGGLRRRTLPRGATPAVDPSARAAPMSVRSCACSRSRSTLGRCGGQAPRHSSRRHPSRSSPAMTPSRVRCARGHRRAVPVLRDDPRHRRGAPRPCRARRRAEPGKSAARRRSAGRAPRSATTHHQHPDLGFRSSSSARCGRSNSSSSQPADRSDGSATKGTQHVDATSAPAAAPTPAVVTATATPAALGRRGFRTGRVQRRRLGGLRLDGVLEERRAAGADRVGGVRRSDRRLDPQRFLRQRAAPRPSSRSSGSWWAC